MKKEEIEKKAQEILRDHNLLQFPVDPLKVARALNIKVMNAKFSDPNISGVISKRGNEVSILLDYDDIPARKRFSIAHEIGHYVLHMNDADDYEIIDNEDNYRTTAHDLDGWDNKRRMEWEANTFAAALLMDEGLVRKEWELEKNIKILAWKFQVSESAIAVRLSSLNLTDEFL